MNPILLKNLVPVELLSLMNKRAELIKASGYTDTDNELFKRQGFHNDPFFAKIHQDIFSPIVQKKVGKILKPSYNFLAFYHMNEGICPVHLDRPQCYITLDICLNQKKIWPLYINVDRHEFIDPEDSDLIEKIKKESQQFDLNPGDGLIYSGTEQPHWRNKIDTDNYCHLVFFHFVPEAFVGELN